MNNFYKIIHKNRDENSFTARLFEFELFPKWFKGNDDFLSFVDLLKSKSRNNYECIIKKFPNTNIGFFETEEELVFKDAMLFLETRDIYGCMAKSGIKNNSNSFIEFDCVIVCENEIKEEIVICFEVKCYKDLENGEIENQFNWLEYFKSESLYTNYYHFALISYDNLKNSRNIFKIQKMASLLLLLSI